MKTKNALSVLLLFTFFVSCKKSYICKCKTNQSGEEITTIKALSKKRAYDKCAGVDPGFGGVECAVK